MKIRAFLYLYIFLLFGCNFSDKVESDLNNNSILARYSTGEITVSELENYIIKLAPNERWNSSYDVLDWYKSKINQLITEESLLEEADLIGVQNYPDFKRKASELERNFLSSEYIATFTYNNSIDESQLKSYYDEKRDQFVYPEKRYVYHIFKSNTKNNNRQLLEKIRNRAVNGENFSLLAEKYSDSESRHKKGMLGMVQRGDLSEDFDKIVFSLNKHEISTIQETRDGFHVFYISDILEAQTYTFESVKNIIQQKLQKQNYLDFINSIISNIKKPEPYNIFSLEELKEAVQKRDLNVQVLTIGNYIFLLSDLIKSIQENQKALDLNDLPSIHLYLREVGYRELIYQYRLDDNNQINKNKTLEDLKQKLKLETIMATKLRVYLNQNPEIINQYYDQNKLRFASPVLLDIERIIFPKSIKNSIMPDLESAVIGLNKGEFTTNQIIERYNGITESLGFLNIKQLKRIDPEAVKFAFRLDVEEYSPPYSLLDKHVIIKLNDRKETVIQPLALIRDSVIEQYLFDNSSEIFSKIKENILENSFIDTGKIKLFHSKSENYFMITK
jgi:parvulin-like peptidyl-prolyl isomerase